jgi:nitroreductase
MHGHGDLAGASAAVDEAITSRRSIRKFTSTPVSRDDIEHLLGVASRAPSGTNMQPWRVTVLGGEKKDAVQQALLDAYHDPATEAGAEFNYYPAEFPEPYKTRRRTVGWGLYGLLGIEKADKDKMLAQQARNYLFFDAPVGMIFTIDRVLEIGSWLDYGMFLENIMVAARGRGLDTCPQVSFARYHKVLRRHLDIPDEQVVMCGMSIGYADPAAPENQLVTEREPVDRFARFIGL